MLKQLFSVVIFILLVTSIFTLAFNIQPVKATGTIYIRADGNIDPPATPIQRDGDYYTLTDNITASADGIVIERDNVILDGTHHTVQGPAPYVAYCKGINLSGRKNVTIKNVEIRAFDFGIYLNYSSDSNIHRNNIEANNLVGLVLQSSSNNGIATNNITYNYYGIQIRGSDNNCISGNQIVRNGPGFGIALISSSNNTLFHNNFINNAQHVCSSDSVNVWDDGYASGGNYWSEYASTDSDGDGISDTVYTIDENNTDHYPLMNPYGSIQNLNNSLVYLTIQSAINALETLNGHTIFVRSGTYCENVIVNKAISLVGEDKGTTKIIGDGSNFVIFLGEVQNVVISGFTVQGSGKYPYAGINLFRSAGNTIRDNIVESNDGIGVRLNFADDNTISGNEITDNQCTLSCEWSTNTLIESNYVFHNQVGLDLYGSNGTRIVGNNISRNGRFGIAIFGGNNLIIENTIAFNDLGIWFYGLGTMTIDNRVCHNNLVSNIEHAQTVDFTAIWDDGYPSGGNYWSDYNGTDLYSGPYQNETGRDGIGDVPYVIDTNNQDNYPLMPPYVPVLGDLNQDGIVNVLDAIQTASAFGSHVGDPGWNEQADINRDGVVNILDVIVLANNFGKH